MTRIINRWVVPFSASLLLLGACKGNEPGTVDSARASPRVPPLTTRFSRLRTRFSRRRRIRYSARRGAFLPRSRRSTPLRRRRESSDPRIRVSRSLLMRNRSALVQWRRCSASVRPRLGFARASRRWRRSGARTPR